MITLFGDKKTFALEVELTPDPDGGKYAFPEECISWGRLSIWINGLDICAPYGINWYLLPTLEWLARNWAPLLHESKLPSPPKEGASPWEIRDEIRESLPFINEREAERQECLWYDWSARHGLASSVEGGICPDLLILRDQDSIALSWGPPSPAGLPEGLCFNNPRGNALIPLETASSTLYDFLISLTSQIALKAEEEGIESGRISSLMETVRGIPSSQSEEMILWLFGLTNRQEEARSLMARVKEVAGNSFKILTDGLSFTEGNLALQGSSLASMMYGSLSPEIVEQDAICLSRAILTPSNLKSAIPRLEVERKAHPYLEGYELAMSLHDYLSTDLATIRPVDIDKTIEKMGIDIASIELQDKATTGVAIVRAQGGSTVLINENNERNATAQGRRFTMAHELCHILIDHELGRPLALASGPWTSPKIEQRANAFAAMFLMPKDIIEGILKDSPDVTVTQVSSTMNTGKKATAQHMKNIGYPIEEKGADEI